MKSLNIYIFFFNSITFITLFLLFKGDKQINGDIKALQKGQSMLEGKKVLACSLLTQDDIYLSGIVGAAMKKQVISFES